MHDDQKQKLIALLANEYQGLSRAALIATGTSYTDWAPESDTYCFELPEPHPTRDDIDALRNEIKALRTDVMYLHQQICLLQLNAAHGSDEAEDYVPESLGEHIVDVSMLLTDKPYRRHDK